MSGIEAVLGVLLRQEPSHAAPMSLEQWLAARLRDAPRFDTPVDAALAGGFAADRLGYAFAAGYQAALHALWPSLPPDHVVGFAATEAGGARPSGIQTRLEPAAGGFVLHGEKSWGTLASVADELLVVASVGRDEAGRNRLRVARVSTGAPGVRVEPLPPTPFAPEIPHATVRLDGVHVATEALLPGDGYSDFLKPFRTIEDLHVHAALLGYLIGVGRRAGWPAVVNERTAALAVAARALAAATPSDPAVHVALGGVLDLSRQLVADTAAHWMSADEDERERWKRDLPLLAVAQRARSARLARAWELLGNNVAKSGHND